MTHRNTPTPTDILQNLIRFDTTNPPGNEAACIAYLQGLFEDAGFSVSIPAGDPARPNLVTRLPGRGEASPLLLYGHVDVVTTSGQTWTQPPFAGEIRDGCVWGRGALDMKGGVAMMVHALLQARRQGLVPAGDVILAVVSDEEVAGEMGARYLVEHHADRFRDVRFAVGEFGGFPLRLGGRSFYTIQVAEKQVCWLNAHVHGPGGHGAFPMRGGAMAALARVLGTLDRTRLPVHVTPVMRRMVETITASLSPDEAGPFRRLLDPATTDQALDELGPAGSLFDAALHHTANATIVHGGHKANVIPTDITLTLDGRILPGFGPDDLIDELQGVIGEEVTLEVVQHVPGPQETDMGLFDFLGDILIDADPAAIPMPFLLSGTTDARHFSRLGIQTYGFLPLNLPPDFNFVGLIHAADERVPVESLNFGARAVFRVLERYREV